MKFHYLFIVFLLSSCASKEYYQTKDACTKSAYQAIPAKYEQRTYTYYETKEVPTGEFNCSTSSNSDYSYYGGSTVYGRNTASTNCKPITKQIREEKVGITTVDVYKSYRDNQVESCVIDICKERYGNKDCER